MKWKDAKNKPLYKRREANDGHDLTKSAFETFFVIVLIIFALVFIFSVFFRIVTFDKRSGDKIQTYSYVCSKHADTLKKGEIVSVDTGYSVSAGEITGLKGDAIVIARTGDEAVNCVTYNGKRYFSDDELAEVLPKLSVPEGYVMLNGDITNSDELRVGDLVKEENIVGQAKFLIYPFRYFGKDPATIKN